MIVHLSAMVQQWYQSLFKPDFTWQHWVYPVGIWGLFILARADYFTTLTEGSFTYLLDDSYIHLAIAKNLYLNGVFGITNRFSAVSSSPLFTLTLYVLNLLFGLNEYYSLWLNILGSALLLISTIKLFSQKKIPPFFASVLALALFVVCPVSNLVFSGLEHVWHIYFLILLFLEGEKEKPNLPKLALWAFLVSAARYEGLFSVAVLGGYLFWQKKLSFKQVIILGAFASIQPVIYGIISAIKGGYFLPNSLILKSTDILTLKSGANKLPFPIAKIKELIAFYPLNLLLIIGLCIIIWTLFKKLKPATNYWILIGLGTLLLHGFFGKYGWVWRYEGYLIFILTLAILIWIQEYSKMLVRNKIIAIILCFGLLIPRTITVTQGEELASYNIYSQMVQMGWFCRNYLGNETVAVNDIGAIAWNSNVKVMDCVGLSDNEIMRTVLTKPGFNPFTFKKIAKERNAHYAILFPNVYWPLHDSNWVECGKFITKDNLVCADSTVLFFALDAAQASKLKLALKEFKKTASSGCEVLIYKEDYR